MIEVTNLTKSYGPIEALRGVSFNVAPGEIVGLLGPNGAGKSTAMKILTGYLQPDGGEVKVDGLDVLTHTRQVQARIGYLPENAPLYPELTVQTYLLLMADLREIPREQQIESLSRAVYATNLADHLTRPIGHLSKGYRQRVGLAQAIVHEPDLLVLDEPTEGLDPNQRVEIRHLIGALGRDHTVILSTHVLPEVQHTCSRLLIINQGGLVADGPVAQLVARAKGMQQVAVEAEGAGVMEALKTLPGVTNVEDRGTREGKTSALVTASAADDLRPAVFRLAGEHGWTLYELHAEGGSLEELFRQLTTSDGGKA